MLIASHINYHIHLIIVAFFYIFCECTNFTDFAIMYVIEAQDYVCYDILNWAKRWPNSC